MDKMGKQSNSNEIISLKNKVKEDRYEGEAK
jgi:hypothetical protein